MTCGETSSEAAPETAENLGLEARIWRSKATAARSGQAALRTALVAGGGTWTLIV